MNYFETPNRSSASSPSHHFLQKVCEVQVVKPWSQGQMYRECCCCQRGVPRPPPLGGTAEGPRRLPGQPEPVHTPQGTGRACRSPRGGRAGPPTPRGAGLVATRGSRGLWGPFFPRLLRAEGCLNPLISELLGAVSPGDQGEFCVAEKRPLLFESFVLGKKNPFSFSKSRGRRCGKFPFSLSSSFLLSFLVSFLPPSLPPFLPSFLPFLCRGETF